ncbi:MAG TPA: hypothetical protein VL287_02885 [Gemmatimonadales bacterium]|jgi:hypothetical protein|nr:hypothetical protein [Gemmatimonadales bacterium]
MTNTIARFGRSVRRAPLAGALVLLAGCASVTPIGELLDNSSKYNGKTVQIQGTVKGSAGVLGRGGYQVADKTGTLTVISEVSEPPRTGAEVSVKGVFESLFTLGSKSLAVLREQSHEYK